MSFQHFDQFLQEIIQEPLSDYWYDVGVIEGEEMIASFTEQDWQQLLEAVDARPLQWVIACLDVVYDYFHPMTIALVVHLLHTSSEKSVVEGCLDILQSLFSLGHDLTPYHDKLLSALEKGNASVKESRTASLLLQRLRQRIS